jgi:hypothetical protein
MVVRGAGDECEDAVVCALFVAVDSLPFFLSLFSFSPSISFSPSSAPVDNGSGSTVVLVKLNTLLTLQKTTSAQDNHTTIQKTPLSRVSRRGYVACEYVVRVCVR